MSKKTVKKILIGIIVLIIVWDISLATDGIQGNTITAIVRDFTDGWELVASCLSAYLAGLLSGHFWK